MYCRKCGKFIGTNDDVCDECRQKEAAFNGGMSYQTENTYQPPRAPQDTSAINLGAAIAAMVLAMVGLIFVCVGFAAILVPEVAIVCMILGLVPTILGLIFGIQSISNFKQTSHIKSGKRIPVLILGIASVVNAGTSLLYAFCLIILAGMM